MEESQKKSTFDRLVAGLNSDERTAMLSRLNQNGESHIELINDAAQVDTFTGNLSTRLKNESIFYRIYIWFRSFITKIPQSQIYNEDVLLNMAKKINRDHPGILSPQGEFLDSLFYERLTTLKTAADFFKPYIFIIDENPGAFYVFLSSFVAPQLSDNINSVVDPYNLPDDIEPDNNVRTDLLKKLDDLLKNMQGSVKNNIYQAVKSVQWLTAFSELPFIHFISQFTDIKDGVFTCPYTSAKVDYQTFATVFDYNILVPNEVLEALFLFSQKKEIAGNYMTSDIEDSVKKFMNVAASHLKNVKMFLSVVPIISMGKIIFKDYNWTSNSFGGGEDWFSKFRAQWRKIIEIRWTDFLRERKKALLSAGLKNDFNLTSFPEMPNRPWTELWGGVPFNCEMTGGFLAWYTTNLFPSDQNMLNFVMMEGIFIRNENRSEYADALDKLSKAAESILQILTDLDFKGSLGVLFDELSSSSTRTFKTQSTVDNIMKSLETKIIMAVSDFCDALRTFEALFKGIFEEFNDGIHGPLQNFNSLKGHDNLRFKDSLRNTRKNLGQVLHYLMELEPIDKK